MHRGRTDEYIFTGVGRFLCRAFRIDSERTLAGPPSGETGEGPWQTAYSLVALIGFWADRLGLWAGPPRSGGSLLAAHLVAPSGAAAAGSGLSAAARRLPAPDASRPPSSIPCWQPSNSGPLPACWPTACLADVLLFGTFLVWAVVDRISLKRRAPAAGSRAQPSKVNDLIAVVGGLALYVAFILWLHLWLIGVSPIAR